MLDPVKLRVLRSVAATGSIRASAEALGYTPSAVSQQLSGLRRETGVDLVERSGRGIEITPAGAEIARAAGTALDALDDVQRLAANLRDGRSGTLTFAYMTSVAATWVPRLAQDVRVAFPDLSLTLLHRDCSVSELDLRGDVLIADDIDAEPGTDWQLCDLLEESYVALVPSSHPLASRESVALADLAEIPWATDDPLDSTWFARILSACHAAGFTPRVEVNPPDYSAVLGFIASGGFVSVQPSLLEQNPPPGVVVLPLRSPAPRRSLQVWVRRSSAKNPAVQFMVQRLWAIAAEHAERIPGITLLGEPPQYAAAPSRAPSGATAG